MSVMLIFGAVIIFVGIYIIVSAVQMKRKNEIKGMLILAEEEALRCKNKEGFIAYMYGKELIAGISVMAMGAALMVLELIEAVGNIPYFFIIAAILVIFWFQNSLNQARERFF